MPPLPLSLEFKLLPLLSLSPVLAELPLSSAFLLPPGLPVPLLDELVVYVSEMSYVLLVPGVLLVSIILIPFEFQALYLL